MGYVKKEQFSVAFDPADLDKLRRLAEIDDRSLSNMIRFAVIEYLKSREEV